MSKNSEVSKFWRWVDRIVSVGTAVALWLTLVAICWAVWSDVQEMFKCPMHGKLIEVNVPEYSGTYSENGKTPVKWTIPSHQAYMWHCEKHNKTKLAEKK